MGHSTDGLAVLPIIHIGSSSVSYLPFVATANDSCTPDQHIKCNERRDQQHIVHTAISARSGGRVCAAIGCAILCSSLPRLTSGKVGEQLQSDIQGLALECSECFRV